VLIAIGCCVLAMMCRSRQWQGNAHWESLNDTPLVMREDVEDLYGEGSWECDVCSFHNEVGVCVCVCVCVCVFWGGCLCVSGGSLAANACVHPLPQSHSKCCILCGAEKGFLTRSGPLRDAKGVNDGDLSSFSIAGVSVTTHSSNIRASGEVSGRFVSGQLSGLSNMSGPLGVTQVSGRTILFLNHFVSALTLSNCVDIHSALPRTAALFRGTSAEYAEPTTEGGPPSE
jgi:hypothetical protein